VAVGRLKKDRVTTSGNTAARPSNPEIGDTHYDGTLGFLMIYDGTAWVPCSAPASQPTIAVTDVGTNVAYGTVQGSVAFTEGVTGGKAAGFTATQGAFSATGSSSPLVVTITGNPGSYSFTGTAYNGFGTSVVSPTVSQTLTSVPQAPTIGTATTGNGQLSLTFTAGATGGKSITNYQWSTDGTTYTALSPADTTSPVIIPGLTNGTSYTVRLKAVNANGVSSASSASNSATPNVTEVVDYLVLAGGGGGAGYGGGGGAGGLRSTVGKTGRNATLESAVTISAGVTCTVTVGAGAAGTAYNATRGPAGSDSVFSGSGFTTVTSLGGGAGGSNGSVPGADGGCGGGGNAGHNMAGGSGTAGQGYDGGTAVNNDYYTGGGGGGTGGAGAASAGTAVGNGGVGLQIADWATPTSTGVNSGYYGGGGGGSSNQNRAGAGGLGGGGAGANEGSSAGNGTANTGGGGGAAIAGYTIGNGGSGLVLLRFNGTYTAAGTTGSPTRNVTGGYTYYTFTGDGSITI
jgi:hypothetical protein